MNGCIALFIILYLWQRQLFRNEGLRPLFWQEVSNALQRRDYLLETFLTGNSLEMACKDRILVAIRLGSMRAPLVDELDRAFRGTTALALKSQRLLRLYMLHMGLGLALAFSLRFLLLGRWRIHPDDLSALGFASCVVLLSCVLLQRAWPRLWSQNQKWALAMVDASLLGKAEGPWQQRLRDLDQLAWREGFDPEPERRQTLRTWVIQEESRFEGRLAIVEEALGPCELAFSLLLLAILDSLPLLERLSLLNTP